MHMSTPSFWSKVRHPRRLFSLLSAVLILMAGAPQDATADASDLIEQLGDVQNAILQAASQQLEGDTAAAIGTLDSTLVTLESLRTSLTDPSLAAELGTKVRAVRNRIRVTKKKVSRAKKTLERGRKKARVKLKKLRAAAKSAFRAASKVGRPVIAELNPRSAGFHKPGTVVQFQIYAADGGPCNETPVVEVENACSSSAIDLDSVAVDESTGILSLTMGDDEGAGSVTVTACGRSGTVFVYNYGSKASTGLPKGFPTNLPTGTYSVTYAASGIVAIPKTSLGTVELEDTASFASEIVALTRNTMDTISSIQGCSSSVAYSAFNGTSFRATWSIVCSVGPLSAEETVVFRIRKL